MTPAVAQALRTAKYIYLTTYGPTGRPGTVPVWCWLHEGAVYFTTAQIHLGDAPRDPFRIFRVVTPSP